MARRGRRPGDTPAEGGTANTLRQRGTDDTTRDPIDGADELAVRAPAVVLVTTDAAPSFDLSAYTDAVVLHAPSEAPAGRTWPLLVGLLVHVVVAALRAVVRDALVRCVLLAGADTVRVFEVSAGRLVEVDALDGLTEGWSS